MNIIEILKKINHYTNDISNITKDPSRSIISNTVTNSTTTKTKVNEVIQTYFDSINHNSELRRIKTWKKPILRRQIGITKRLPYCEYLISNIQYIYHSNEVTLQFCYFICINKKIYKKIKPDLWIQPNHISSDNYNNFTQEEKIDVIQQDSNIIKNLSIVLQKIYGCKVNIICNRVHYPYINAQILAQYLGKNANRQTFFRIWTYLVRKVSISGFIPSTFIVGIKLTINGRLITQRFVPRITTRSVVIGTFNPTFRNMNEEQRRNFTTSVDKGKVNLKNNIGAFRITIEICNIIKNNNKV